MYADNVCFVNKTYYIADEDHVTLARKEGDTVYVEFYQWYPVILVLMGVLFYAPQMFWTGMLGSYGKFDFSTIYLDGKFLKKSFI